MYFCSYCEEFKEGNTDGLFLRLFKEEGISTRILKETDNFLVFPTLGAFVEGYLLIAPKKHFLSIGALPDEMYPELKELLKEVKKDLSKYYCKPILFEHGPISKILKGGCCIDHAHIHIVPVKVDILDEIKYFLGTPRQIHTIEELKNEVVNGRQYIFYENHEEDKFIFNPSIVPSQFVRQILAVKLGIPHKWDWRSNIEKEKILNTIKLLRKVWGNKELNKEKSLLNVK